MRITFKSFQYVCQSAKNGRKRRYTPMNITFKSFPRCTLLITGAIFLTVLALMAGCATQSKSASGAGNAPPTEVTVAPVEQRDVSLYSEWIGTLDGFVNADVR